MVSGGGTISKIWVWITKNESKTLNTFRNTEEAVCMLVMVDVLFIFRIDIFTSREKAKLVMVDVEKRNKRQETHQSCSSHSSTQWPTQSHKQYKNVKLNLLFLLSPWKLFCDIKIDKTKGPRVDP